MKISTHTGSFRKYFSDRQVVDIFKDAGFDAIDYSFFDPADYDLSVSDEKYRERYTELRKYVEDKGLYYNQSHAPHPTSRTDKAFTKKRFDEVIRTIKNSSLLGVRNVIVHPFQHLGYSVGNNPDILYGMNLDFYARIIPYCEEYGVTVCVENMWQEREGSSEIQHSTCSRAEEFVRYIDGIGSPFVKACVDIGHTVLVGENPARVLKALGNRVAALHVHDNDGIIDTHTLPFFGTVEWDDVAKSLKEIGYDGEITLEAWGFTDRHGLPTSLRADAAKFMASVARKFADTVEKA